MELTIAASEVLGEILSPAARATGGIIFLTILFVGFGGLFVLRTVTGRHPMTPFQRTFARAGHGHAGVLVILALVSQVFADALNLVGFLGFLARSGVGLAAILIPAGFFVSSAGREVTHPNRSIVLIYIGYGVLAASVATLGVGLIASI